MKNIINKETRLSILFCIAAFLTIAGIALLYIGLFLPPAGVIDWSVLSAFGEVSTFAGALMGMDYTYKLKLHKYKGKTEAESEASTKPKE